MFSRGQLHQQCCEEWTLVSEETQAKMARMAAAAAWGLGKHCTNNNVVQFSFDTVTRLIHSSLTAKVMITLIIPTMFYCSVIH